MDANKKQHLDNFVSRAAAVSKQDQFIETEGNYWGGFYDAHLKWAAMEVPPYKEDSRKRDTWLQYFVRQEPHLAGVLNTAASLASNRGWRLVGGRNLVRSVARVMHDADQPEGARFGKGWRHFTRNNTRAFYGTDMGGVTELGRDTQANSSVIGPMKAMWSTDPTRLKLTGKPKTPIAYYPKGRKMMLWSDSEHFRISNNPSIEAKFNDLGYCAVSVVIEVAKILIAVYRHDQEKLGAAAPQGLLLLRNISQRQWNDAMDSRKEKMAGLEREFFGSVAVLANLGSNDIDAKLIALSELPAQFNRQEFITLLMYLYSLTFGFSPDEFWPVQIGWLLGRNTEAELGLERATQKGDADYFLAFQDVFQRELPSLGTSEPAVLFQFEERNDRGRLMAADVALTWAKVASLLYNAGLQYGQPLLNRDQTLRLLVDQGIIPAEYTDIEEDTQAFDTHAIRSIEQARGNIGIRRYADAFPSEPIMMYRYPTDDWTVLFDSGTELLKPHVWRGHTVDIEKPNLDILKRNGDHQLVDIWPDMEDVNTAVTTLDPGNGSGDADFVEILNSILDS